MHTLRHLERLFSYDDWANRESLASLKKAALAGEPPPKALRWMAHIVAVEQLWMARLLEDGRKVVVWPDLTLEECGTRLDDLREAWREYLGRLGPEDLSRPVSYVSSQGESWTNTVEDILFQTVTHSVYHRGQIAAELRATGQEPVLTDFIHGVRQGLLD